MMTEHRFDVKPLHNNNYRVRLQKSSGEPHLPRLRRMEIKSMIWAVIRTECVNMERLAMQCDTIN